MGVVPLRIEMYMSLNIHRVSIAVWLSSLLSAVLVRILKYFIVYAWGGKYVYIYIYVSCFVSMGTRSRVVT